MDDTLNKQHKNSYQCGSFYEYLTKNYSFCFIIIIVLFNFFLENTVDYDFIKENFIMKIRNAYEKLYDHYNYISSKAITEKQKKQFKKYLVIISLILN